MELHNTQLTFSSSFSIQSTPVIVPPIAASQPVKKVYNAPHENSSTYYSAKILAKRERILELQKEIEDSEEAILNRGREEEDFNPEGEEEDIFDVVVPKIEFDLYGLRVENEIEIKLLEEEIRKLERKNPK